jgi:hypothetical protein
MNPHPNPDHANVSRHGQHHPLRRRLLRGLLTGTVVAAVAGAALAFYLATGSGVGSAKVGTLGPPTNVVATAANSSTSSGPSPVTITWTAPALGGTPTGYKVVRDNGSTQVTVSCSSSPCTDSSVPNGTYTYHVQSLLRSWTSAAANSNSLTVVNDSTPPTTAISFPANSAAYNAVGWGSQCEAGTVTGTCGSSSDASGVAIVRLSVQRSSDGFYWNGSSFVSSLSELFVNATLDSPNATSTTWSLALPTSALSNGNTYTIHVQAKDTVGNDSAPTYTSTATFTYDTSAPSSTISFPSTGPYNATSWNAGAPIAGTASDPAPGSGLANVQVSIQKVGGNYWNGSSFGSASEQLFTASGTSSWSLAFAASNFATAGGGDGSYMVRSYATDHAGNTQATATSQTFTYDNTAPTISREVVADATANSAGFIKQGGTYYAYAQVSDATSGVFSVSADLHTTTTGASSVAMTTSGGPWTIGGQSYNYRSSLQTANASLPESGNPYGFSVTASDVASNSSSANGSVTVDNSGPSGGSVTINGLVGTGSLYSTSTSLSLSLSAGTDAGVGNAASSTFVLQRASATLSSSDGVANGNCGSFGTFSTIATGPSASYTDSTGLSSGNCYRYRYVVGDQLGNQTTYTSNVDAKIDTSVPSVSAVTPSNASGNTFVNGSTVWVNGQAGKSGAFDVGATATDGQSGILKVNFPAFGSTSSTDQSSTPYSLHYTWSGAITAGSKTVTATNNATLTNTGSFTVSSDTTNPTGGSITANGSASQSYNTSGNISLSVTNFTDAGSGIASNVVTRASATLTNGSCGSFGGSTVVGGSSDTGLASGCYQYTLTGTDNVGNTATATSAIVIVDTVAPSSALTFPTTSGPFNATSWNAGASSKITGTASDASPSSGLANVQVSVQKSGGNYWNGTSFGSASEVKTTASGTSSWTLAFAAANFATTGGGDGSYIVRVYATDNAGNTQATATSQTFTYDNTAPSASVTFPSNNGNYNASGWTSGGTTPCGSSGTICGQASDTTSGISGASSITLTITRTGNSTTWTGSTFSSGTNTVHPTTYNSGTGLWTYTFPSGNFPADGTYSVAVQATDAAGNTSTTATNSLIYDNTAPTVSVTFPANNGNYNGSGWTSGGTTPCGSSGTICGQATDATSGISGASSITLTITRSSNGNTWNGSSFASGTNTVQPTTYNSGTGLWTYTFPNSNFPTDDTYSVAVKATDRANNTSANSTNSFLYDNTPPNVSISAPLGTSPEFATQPVTFAGTAGNQAADSTHSADSTSVTVYVCSGTQTSCGASGPSLAQTLTATESGGNWNVSTGLLTTGTTYTAQAQQSDAAGNTGQSSVDTFTTATSLSETAHGTYTLTVAPHITSFGFTLNGAGGGGGMKGAAGGNGGAVQGTITLPNSSTSTTFTVVVGAGGAAGINNPTGGTGGGTGCANGGGTGSGTNGARGGGGGGGATCIYTGTFGATSIIALAGGGGGGGGGATSGGAGGIGGGGPNTNPGSNCGSACNGGNGATGETGGGGGATATTLSFPFTITNTVGAAGTGGSPTAGGSCSGSSCGAGGTGGAGSGNSGATGGGGGGGYASGGGGGGDGSSPSGGGGGGSAYTGGAQVGGQNYTVTVIAGGTSNGGATPANGGGGGNTPATGGDGSVTFTGAGLSDPPNDDGGPDATEITNPYAYDTTTTTDTSTTDTTTTDTTTTDTTTTDTTTTDTTTTDTTTTDTTTTDTTTTATTDTTTTGTTGAPISPASARTSTAGLSTWRQVLFFSVLGGSVLGLVALLTMPIPRRRRARRKRGELG